MTSKYTITAGTSNVTPPRQPPQALMILDGITKDEKLVAQWRRRQEEISQQLLVQREWLADDANRNDPRWEQRQQIHEDRKQEHAELERTVSRTLEGIEGQIETLDGSEREEAIRRLLSWTEPPF